MAQKKRRVSPPDEPHSASTTPFISSGAGADLAGPENPLAGTAGHPAVLQSEGNEGEEFSQTARGEPSREQRVGGWLVAGMVMGGILLGPGRRLVKSLIWQGGAIYCVYRLGTKLWRRGPIPGVARAA